MTALDNVVVEGLDPSSGLVGQYADVALGPGPVNFTPTDNVSPPGSPSTVVVTQLPRHLTLAVPCQFQVRFPDFGNAVSLDNNASLGRIEVAVDGAGAMQRVEAELAAAEDEDEREIHRQARAAFWEDDL
jgi:hypothetical protein